MKLTEQKLRDIVQEELRNVLSEVTHDEREEMMERLSDDLANDYSFMWGNSFSGTTITFDYNGREYELSLSVEDPYTDPDYQSGFSKSLLLKLREVAGWDKRGFSKVTQLGQSPSYQDLRSSANMLLNKLI